MKETALAKGGRGGARARKERAAKDEETQASAVSKALVLTGNLTEKASKLLELRNGWDAAVKKSKAANSDKKAILDEVEELGVSRRAFKDALKVINDLSPEQRENYDQSLTLVRQTFGFGIDGQGLLFESGDAGDGDPDADDDAEEGAGSGVEMSAEDRVLDARRRVENADLGDGATSDATKH